MQKNGSDNAAVKRNPLLLVVAVVVVGAAAATTMLKGPNQSTNNATSAVQAVNAQGDLEILTADITEDVTYYAYDQLDTKMEVIAVKASDGSIRTAFNTCQVCYGSGRGYYEQEGAFLVCQNCGNRFSTDDVEVTRGGCNPLPITAEYKIEADGKIVIPKSLFEQAQGIFANWKV